MVEPSITGPTWNLPASSVGGVGAAGAAGGEEREEVWRESEASAATYEWLCGRDSPQGNSPTAGGSDAVEAIHIGEEAER